VNACFADVIRWDEDAEKPVFAYPEDCVWCLACELACPENCIDVVPNIPAPLRSSY
jgi:NAD-dependent dihydropyrimidine dehydrogenase PreA subunit